MLYTSGLNSFLTKMVMYISQICTYESILMNPYVRRYCSYSLTLYAIECISHSWQAKTIISEFLASRNNFSGSFLNVV